MVAPHKTRKEPPFLEANKSQMLLRLIDGKNFQNSTDMEGLLLVLISCLGYTLGNPRYNPMFHNGILTFPVSS